MLSARCYNCPDQFQRNSATEAQSEQLQSLLRGNCHPYHSPSSNIPKLLSTTKDDLQRCNDEIAKQQLYLTSLQKQREILECYIHGYESLISPIRKLPFEVLQQTFLHICRENLLDMDGIRIPGLILAHVCSHWRSICFDTREIWSTISINIQWTDPGLNQAVQFLLEKSDPYPISLAIDRLDDTDHARDLFRGLAAESDRWSELALGGMVDVTLFEELAAIKSRLPILRTLVLPDETPDLDYFEVAPLLDTLDVVFDLQNFPLPWAQFRKLTLREPARPLHILSLCPVLITAELIDASMFKLESPDIHIKSNLSCLTIEISYADLKGGLPWLSQLTLPALHSLSIKRDPAHTYGADIDPAFSIAQLQSLVSRSRCTITTFSWANIPTNFPAWITLLHSLHCLHSLFIEDFGRSNFGDDLVTDAFFDLLKGPPDSPFLPSLEHLSNALAFSTSGLIRALQSRRTTEKEGKIVRLKSFELHLTRKLLNIQFLESLKELAGSGLKMVIRDKSGLVWW
ncbi:hypothetical protein C8J56DRAFT_931188 [Mycena floridula]|nr:hypothetical protein C8J56DRAFT_931188 [Mycena floridula]